MRLAEGKHAFLVDHNIDGRVLMPATSYVCTAWEAAATRAGKEVKDFPVEFQDVQIHQAVVVTDGQKVNLGVQITPNNRFFVSRPPLLACAYLRRSKALPTDIMQIALSSTMGSSFECQPVRNLQCLTASQAQAAVCV